MAATENSDLRAMPSGQSHRKALLSRIGSHSNFYWVRLLLENPAALFSIIFLFLLLGAAFLVPSLSPHDPLRVDPLARLSEPSGEYWFGTDNLGRDVFVRSFYGARTSLLVGASVMVLAALAGSVLGLVSGYYDRLDSVIMRAMDGILAFPTILLAIAIMASLGPATQNVIAALALVTTPNVARLVRGQTLSIKNQAYVEAARSIGQSDFIILRRHIFMNSLSPLIVQCTFLIAIAILAEAALSFLGAGVPAIVPTWGNMLRDGQGFLDIAWWVAVVPGLMLFATVLAMNLIGDGLRDALDPRARLR